MANYYVQGGRYFGEDTSFYEFDADCLKRRENKPDFNEDCQNGSEDEPNTVGDCTNRSKMKPDHDEDCLNGSGEKTNTGEDCTGRRKMKPDHDEDYLEKEETHLDHGEACLKKEEKGPDFDCGACSPGADPSENHPDSPGDFDRLFTTRKLDMLKTAIPFLPVRQQKVFACAVKLVEFRNLMGYFGKNRQTLLGACSDEDPQMRLADMLDALRVYCSPAEQEQIDSLFQVLMTVQMMREGL